jgi:metallo-beta-lactamase class B
MKGMTHAMCSVHRARCTGMGLAAGLAVVALLGADVAAQDAPAAGQGAARAERMEKERDNLELQRVPAFKAFDNLHYVGVGWVGAWLLTTTDGLILIDTVDRPQHVDHLLDGVRKMGVDPKNIKYVIITQAHADHYAGAARIQKEFGAQVAMGEGDWKVVETPPAPGRGGANRPETPRRDIVLKDGETLTLGNTTLKFWSTPGHTPGTTSVDFTVFDNGRPYRAFVLGGGAPAGGVPAAEQFLASIQKVEKLQDGVQVRVVNHPWMDPQFWDRMDRLRARKPGEPHAMVDAQAFRTWIQAVKASGQKDLEAARLKANPPAR